MNTAIITGAASGIGLACAHRFANSHDLVLGDVSEEKLAVVLESLTSDGHQVKSVCGDIADEAYVDALVSAAVEDATTFALVHCAGLSPKMAEAKRIYEVNLLGTARLLTCMSPHMGDGSVAVCIASQAGTFAKVGCTPAVEGVLAAPLEDSFFDALEQHEVTADLVNAYANSKRGVQLLVEKHATSWGERNARIVSISPGMIDTPMGQFEAERQPLMATLLEATPLGRMGRAEEIAEVVHFMCSPAASFVTGVDLLVDGGTTNVMLSAVNSGAATISHAET